MAKTKIEAEFSFGHLKVVVFANPPTADRKKTFRTIAPSRAYKEEDSGEWKYCTSFSVADTLVLQKLLGQAVDYVVAREQAETEERRRGVRSTLPKHKNKKVKDDVDEPAGLLGDYEPPPVDEDRPF
jgi:hypothetical protein